jgi:hypothetical protein
MYDDDLSPEELAALRALPRERDPGEMLEHRTVRALRARNLLRQRERRGFVFSGPWVAAAAAGFIAVFAGGFSLGQWLEARQSDKTLVELRRQDAAQAAAVVQQTGSAYLAALSALAEASNTSRSSHDVAQGREVASSILHAAANQMVRISPEDPLALQILRGLERARGDSTSTSVADAKRRVAWF